MIKTIIFDLGNVIVPFDFKRGYAGMAELTGMPPAEVRQRIIDTGAVPVFESGGMTQEEFVECLNGALGYTVDFATFSRIWSSIFLPEPNFSESFITGLKERHRMLILSNTNSIHWNMIRSTYPVVSLFDDFVLSHEVKAMKPSPVIYEAAVRKAGCSAAECFFTDDVAAYVEGARTAGLQAVQFESPAQLQGELRALGVSC